MKNNIIITVFTCTYNRANTIGRTYESLCRQTRKDFKWLVVDDGSTDGTRDVVEGWQKKDNGFEIQYVYKENGGLHTGYNRAIELMDTELCVCIDSDDWMPDDAVEKILSVWRNRGSDKYAGIIGLDCPENGLPIGGLFPEDLKTAHIVHLPKWHQGDVKMVHRTELLKKVAPMEVFPGEKFFNPIYLFIKVDMMLPMLIVNDVFCIVDYQDANNSMSKNIVYQYYQSPNSFKELRRLHMGNPIEPYRYRLRHAAHYVSSCIMTKDKAWLRNSPMPISTFLVAPFGYMLYRYIKRIVSQKNNSYK